MSRKCLMMARRFDNFRRFEFENQSKHKKESFIHSLLFAKLFIEPLLGYISPLYDQLVIVIAKQVTRTMPRSGGARQSDANNDSAEDIFESPNRRAKNSSPHHRNPPSRKRKLQTNSRKQVDPPHRKRSHAKNNKLLQKGQQVREDRPRRHPRGQKETHSMEIDPMNDIFEEPNYQPKNSASKQQGNVKNKASKKKNRLSQKESGNNVSAMPSKKTNKSTRKKNRSKNKKNRNQAMDTEPADDIFAAPSQLQMTDQIIHQQSRRKNDHQNTKGTQVKKKHVQQNSYEIQAPAHRERNEYESVLEWSSPNEYVPLSEEESIVEFMFQRNGKQERGMLKDKPSFLVSKYRKAMQQRAPSMTFPQVLSLRRHHIKLFNPWKDMTRLGLGQVKDINASANLFECAVEDFLTKSSIDFRTEEDQKKAAKEKNQILRATPDFVLPQPILLRKVQDKARKKGKSNEKKTVIEERTIHWIEAKMYYGASTIPHGSRGAVGTVLKKAKSYVDTFGEGAFLFMMGCGDKLAAELNAIGVSVLDCSGNTVSLDRVHDHQKTWCANEKGQILP